jgi:hypothetical protein
MLLLSLDVQESRAEQRREEKGREGRIEEGQAVREGMRRKEDPMRSVKEENGEGGRE